MADGENFEQVRSNIDLEVGVAAKVRFDPGFGVNNELTITEGEEAKVGQVIWEEIYLIFASLFKDHNEISHRSQN